MSRGLILQVSGDRALFARPEMSVERVSYDVITPSAARGIIDAIHWKPAIRWSIDRIHVLKPVKFASFRRNEVNEKVSESLTRQAMRRGDLNGLGIAAADYRMRAQRSALFLIDVNYVIEAHFELTSRAGADDTEAKHIAMAKRRARDGQCFSRPVLGTRECAADFHLIDDARDIPPAIPETRDLGWMLHDIDFANGNASRFFRARMDNGVIDVATQAAPGLTR